MSPPVCGCPGVVALSWGAVIHGAHPVRCGLCPRTVRVAFYDGARHVCTRCHDAHGKLVCPACGSRELCPECVPGAERDE